MKTNQKKKKQKKNPFKKKKDSKKEITFNYTNPNNKKNENKKMTICKNTPMSDIIQDFNTSLGVNNIIGIEINRAKYMKDNNIIFCDTSLYYEENLDDVEINFIFDPSSNPNTVNISSNNKKEAKKYIMFKCTHPINKKNITIKCEFNKDITIPFIIQNFNNFLGVSNIIGFEKDLVKYMNTNEIKFVDTSLCYENLDCLEINFICSAPDTITTRAEIGSKKQLIKIFFFEEVKTIEIDFFSPASKVFQNCSKFNKKVILYFPGGNLMTTSINDFQKKKGKYQNFLYAIVNKSNFDAEKYYETINIDKKSIIALFPELNKSYYNSYVCYLCCVLKYIQMNFYKSLHIIKSFFETISFVPFLTSLYSIYDKKVTKLSIFTIVSFLLYYAPTFDDLKKLFSAMSSHICVYNSDTFKRNQNPDHSFKHDFNSPPQLPKIDYKSSNENIWRPIFIANAKELRDRNYWSIVSYNTGYILSQILPKEPSEQYNMISYYDPTEQDIFGQMSITQLDDYEKHIKSKKNTTYDKFNKCNVNIKYSQATIAIIDYSGSMIACFDEKSERRSKIAINIINQFIQAGNDMSVNDPFTILNKNCNGETKYPLKYNSEDFTSPSCVYDRIESAVIYMTTENYTRKLTENAYKRILLVSDGQDGKSKKTKYDILKLLLERHIILDVILLKDDGNSAKDLFTLSHISGGDYYRPYSKDDAYFIARYQNLIKKPENKRFEHFKSFKFISNEEFDNRSYNMRIKDNLNIMKACIQKDFYENHCLYSVFSTNPNAINDFQEKRIQKEIDICADYIRTQQKDRKEPFFMIYRKFLFDSFHIEKDKVIVFLKGSNSSKIKVIHQALIRFTYNYPFEMPRIELLSKAELENPLPNGIFKLKSESYKPEMRLIYILFKLNEALVCKEKPIEKNDNLDPINSLDQIIDVFRYYDIPNEKEIKSYSKYFDFR